MFEVQVHDDDAGVESGRHFDICRRPTGKPIGNDVSISGGCIHPDGCLGMFAGVGTLRVLA